MKAIFIKLFLTLVLVTAVANVQAPTVQASLPTQVTSDTASAAVLTARERLKTIYGVDDEQIVANLVESQGKSKIGSLGHKLIRANTRPQIRARMTA